MPGVTATPNFDFKPAYRCKKALAAAATIGASSSATEVVVCAGCARGIIRAKMSGAANLDFHWIGPDVQFATPDQATGTAPTVPTEYASGNPGTVGLVGGTEGNITFSHNGEGYGIIRITDTSGSTNTISYVDVARI